MCTCRVPVDMAPKKIRTSKLLGRASEAPYHGERKRNPCPQSSSRVPTRASRHEHANANANVDDERGHFPSNQDTIVSLQTVLLIHTGQDAKHLGPDVKKRENTA